jgi:osmotically-inducible protein OsmY
MQVQNRVAAIAVSTPLREIPVMARFLTHLVAVATSVATVAATLSACGADHRSGTPTVSAPPAAPVVPAAQAATPRDTDDSLDPALQVTDASLAKALQRSIGGDTVLAQQHIRVTVLRDAVTLSGSVNSVTAKTRAARLVEGFRGPKELHNELVVAAPPRPDADIAQDVRQVLQYDRATRSAKVQVEVNDGMVTLRGPNASLHERRLLVASAARVKGVKDVVLALAPSTTPRVEQRVAADATQRIADDARLDGTHVTVDVQGRSAQLSGMVGSLAQREAAIEDARVDGIDEVHAQALQVDWRAADQARAQLTWSAPADSQLAEAVRRDLGGDARIGYPLPTVTVTDGVVSLSGSLNDFRSQSAARNDAGAVRGVRSVEDHTTVVPARRESDALIQQQVERTVLNDLQAPDGPHLQMTTAGAKVTLRGNVFSEEEKSLIDSDVEAVPGVIGVEDDLQVQGYGAETHAGPSGSLRTRVVERIFWDSRVDATRVVTKAAANGDVTLSGPVYSPGEERAAVEDAKAAGAVHVIDHLRLSGGR